MKSGLSDQLQCVCSTVGFEREDWRAKYYPVECPPDWRVAYFMNDFPAVFLSDSDWFENNGLIEQLVEELEDGFELVLQWPADVTPQAIEAALKRLAPLEQNIACMVLKVDAQSPVQIRQRLQKLAGKYAVSLDCQSAPGAKISALASEFGAGFVWRGETGKPMLAQGAYRLIRLPCLGLRQASTILKALQASPGGRTRIGIFLEPDPRSPQRALELRTVIELLGMA